MFLAPLLRLGALASLAYVGLRLRRHLQRSQSPAQPHAAPAPPIEEDLLVEDPVCRKLVPQKQALTLHLETQTHYFCCDECRRRFLQQGEKSE